MIRIKNKQKNIPMKVWEQIIQFQFVENGESMQWKEKFFVTSPDKNKAKKLSKKFIEKKKEENKNVQKFKAIIIKDLHLSENKPTSLRPSIHGKIIDIKVQ